MFRLVYKSIDLDHRDSLVARNARLEAINQKKTNKKRHLLTIRYVMLVKQLSYAIQLFSATKIFVYLYVLVLFFLYIIHLITLAVIDIMQQHTECVMMDGVLRAV